MTPTERRGRVGDAYGMARPAYAVMRHGVLQDIARPLFLRLCAVFVAALPKFHALFFSRRHASAEDRSLRGACMERHLFSQRLVARMQSLAPSLFPPRGPRLKAPSHAVHFSCIFTCPRLGRGVRAGSFSRRLGDSFLSGRASSELTAFREDSHHHSVFLIHISSSHAQP